MAVFINFKICDNAEVCSGITECANGAITWDVNKRLVINNDVCTSCEKCVAACPAGAIMVARTKEEEQEIITSIENDPRTIKDLMVDRYGASPISETTLISISEAESKIKNNEELLVLELINDEDTPCLIDCVPISELFSNTPYDYFKISSNDDAYTAFSNKYKIIDNPSLLVFTKDVCVFKNDGHVNNRIAEERESFIDRIKKIL